MIQLIVKSRLAKITVIGLTLPNYRQRIYNLNNIFVRARIKTSFIFSLITK